MTHTLPSSSVPRGHIQPGLSGHSLGLGFRQVAGHPGAEGE